MAELSLLWTTGGVTGDQQASYTQAQLATMHRILAACSGFEGVAPGFKNELACTANGANTVAVNTGGAVVDGIIYHNDASQNVNIPSASGAGNTRIDRIVLRADWANFNVSVYRIAGTDAASPTAPAITQTSETTYDITLAQVTVDTAGTVTILNDRIWAAGGTNSLDADAVTLAKMAANSVDSDQYVDGSIDTVHLADDIVDDTKVGNRVLQFYRRQGGSASNWSTAGTTAYTPTTVRMQAGVLSGSTLTGITFPTAFSQAPIISITKVAAGGTDLTGITFTPATTGVTFSAPINGTIHWLAVGPE